MDRLSGDYNNNMTVSLNCPLEYDARQIKADQIIYNYYVLHYYVIRKPSRFTLS